MLERTSGGNFFQSTPGSSRASLSLDTQDHIQRALEYLHRERETAPPPWASCGNSATAKKVFPDVQREPPVFQLMSMASAPGTWHHWKEPGSAFFAPCLQVSTHTAQIHLSLLQAQQAQLPWPFFRADRLPFLNLCGHPPVCLFLPHAGNSRTGHTWSVFSHAEIVTVSPIGLNYIGKKKHLVDFGCHCLGSFTITKTLRNWWIILYLK